MHGIDMCRNIRAISLKFLMLCCFDFEPKISTKCIYSVYHFFYLHLNCRMVQDNGETTLKGFFWLEKHARYLKFKYLQQEVTSDIAPVSSKEFLDIHATIECRFTLKRVRDMIRTYSQIYHTDKYSQHNSVIWLVLLNGWVFVYEPNGCGFKSRCSH